MSKPKQFEYIDNNGEIKIGFRQDGVIVDEDGIEVDIFDDKHWDKNMLEDSIRMKEINNMKRQSNRNQQAMGRKQQRHIDNERISWLKTSPSERWSIMAVIKWVLRRVEDIYHFGKKAYYAIKR